MGQLAPNSQRAVRLVCSSPRGDDRKPYQASSFKNSSRRSMTSLFRMERDGRASACQGTPARMRSVAIGRLPTVHLSSPEGRRAGHFNPQPSI